jgi:hypothetical protein
MSTRCTICHEYANLRGTDRCGDCDAWVVYCYIVTDAKQLTFMPVGDGTWEQT